MTVVDQWAMLTLHRTPSSCFVDKANGVNVDELPAGFVLSLIEGKIRNVARCMR